VRAIILEILYCLKLQKQVILTNEICTANHMRGTDGNSKPNSLWRVLIRIPLTVEAPVNCSHCLFHPQILDYSISYKIQHNEGNNQIQTKSVFEVCVRDQRCVPFRLVTKSSLLVPCDLQAITGLVNKLRNVKRLQQQNTSSLRTRSGTTDIQ
jgi:hypothetical protein